MPVGGAKFTWDEGIEVDGRKFLNRQRACIGLNADEGHVCVCWNCVEFCFLKRQVLSVVGLEARAQ